MLRQATERAMLAVLLSTCLATSAVGQAIWLDEVDGLYAPDTIVTGSTITFHLSMDTEDSAYCGITNGFRVYSDDGAIWDTAYDQWAVGVTDSMFNYRLIPIYGTTGSGADTLGFAGFYVGDLDGMPANTTFDLGTISLGPLDENDIGKHICLDSSFLPPASYWLWSAIPNSARMFPSWDGPHCYTVVEPPDCCVERGDVDDDGDVADIADLVYLNDYVNFNGPEPPCRSQADVNGDGEVDGSDVLYLQAFMFLGGPSPVPCE